jgi:hypothetical protein
VRRDITVIVLREYAKNVHRRVILAFMDLSVHLASLTPVLRILYFTNTAVYQYVPVVSMQIILYATVVIQIVQVV